MRLMKLLNFSKIYSVVFFYLNNSIMMSKDCILITSMHTVGVVEECSLADHNNTMYTHIDTVCVCRMSVPTY